MRKNLKHVLVLSAVLLGLVGSQSFAQVATFDEFGAVGPFGPAVLAPDPGPGGLGPALTYPLPFPVIAGDLALNEPGAPVSSDIIRWNNNGTLVFYSAVNVDPPDAPADTGLPNGLQGNFLGPFAESGVEGGLQDFFWTPGPGQPGFAPGGQVVTYRFISDFVPEPTSATMLLLAWGLIGLRRLR